MAPIEWRMVEWLRIWTKIHHYHYPVIGFCGIIATVVASRPRTYIITVGPVRLNLFYIALLSFGMLLILSIIDKYRPEDYGLGPPESER